MMDTNDPSSSSLDHQTSIEDYTQTEPNGYAGLAFIPGTDMSGNDYKLNESEPIHQGASLVTQVTVASSHMDDTKNGTEKATLNGTSQNDGVLESVSPITNGNAKGITEGVSKS